MKENFYGVIGIAVIVIVLSTVFNFFEVMENYSIINKVNVTILEMAENGSTIEEMRAVVRGQDFRGLVYINGVEIDSHKPLEITDYSNIKVEVKEDYYMKYAIFFETPQLTMISKRAN